jgi:hypothetical protein
VVVAIAVGSLLLCLVVVTVVVLFVRNRSRSESTSAEAAPVSDESAPAHQLPRGEYLNPPFNVMGAGVGHGGVVAGFERRQSGACLWTGCFGQQSL